MEERGGPEVIVAVADPELAQEAVAVVAATGHVPVPVTEPDPHGARWRRAAAVLVDAATAALVADMAAPAPRRAGVHLVHADAADPDWRLAMAVGAETVQALPACGAELVGLLGRPGDADGGGGLVVAVAGAVGGCGTSTAAAALAVAAAGDGTPALLVDADGGSGGADLLLGAEHVPGVRWPDVRAEAGRVDAAAILDAAPGLDGGPAVLTGPRMRDGGDWTVAPAAVAAVADAMVRHGGVAVVDLPRDAEMDAGVAGRADVVALVVPAAVRALAAASRRVARLRRAGADPVAVVAWPAPGGVTAGDVEYATGLAVAAELPHVRGLDREIESTGLHRSLPRLARAVEPLLDLAEGRGR
ncbi:septum site-determining protein Ssd [Corynebacterium sp. 335C]